MINSIRKLMKLYNIDFYWIPGTDPHNNEYTPDFWKRRERITGFTGSFGDALISKKEAFLWTDSRYWIQARKQIAETNFQLIEFMINKKNSIIQFLLHHAKGLYVGIDPELIVLNNVKILEKSGVKLYPIYENLIDYITKKKIKIPQNSINILSKKNTGELTQNKSLRIWKNINTNIKGIIFTDLTNIAWLLNIRGLDIKYTPVCISYLILERKYIFWFCNIILTKEQSISLKNSNIIVKPYYSIYSFLSTYRGRLQIDPLSLNWRLFKSIKQDVIEKDDPIKYMKSCKNIIELYEIKKSHILDAITIIEFFSWLEKNWHLETEISLSEKLFFFLKKNKKFQQLSFPSIIGFAHNSAIVHYIPSVKTNEKITDKNILLIDSGGQYYFGTTDMTRCLHFGKPSKKQKKHYTLVLKGHLALSGIFFPKGTTGIQLDVLAKQYLWKEQLNYNHGTGHGVGHFLSVHENPCISSTDNTPLNSGMVISNEPGIYIENEYGIRIENLYQIKENKSGWLYFKVLTLVPYSSKLIDIDLLTKEEILQIKIYQNNISSKLERYLTKDAKKWLLQQYI